jgi:hypothetical protein
MLLTEMRQKLCWRCLPPNSMVNRAFCPLVPLFSALTYQQLQIRCGGDFLRVDAAERHAKSRKVLRRAPN